MSNMDRETSVAFKTMEEKLKERLGNIYGKTGLDYGCGNGRSTRYFANLGAEMVGVDKDQSAVYQAASLNEDLEFRVAEDLGLKGFDFAVSAFCHVMMPSLEEMKNANAIVRRHLGKGSPYAILTYNAPIWFQGHHGARLNGVVPRSGSGIKVSIDSTIGNVEKQYYFWPPARYWDALRQSGFEVLNDTLIGADSGVMPFEIITSIAV